MMLPRRTHDAHFRVLAHAHRPHGMDRGEWYRVRAQGGEIESVDLRRLGDTEWWDRRDRDLARPGREQDPGTRREPLRQLPAIGLGHRVTEHRAALVDVDLAARLVVHHGGED